MTKLKHHLTTLCTSPYRLFFSVGILLGIASIGIWTFFAIGSKSLDFYPAFHHVFGVISLFLGSFVTGFLLTALPKFTATSAPKRVFIYTLLLICVGEVLALVKNATSIALFLCSLKFLLLLIFALTRLRNAKFTPPPSFIWIGAGLLSVVLGATGKGLVESGIINNQAIAQFCHLAFTRGYIFSLFMGVGSLLIPILSGVHIAQPLQILNKSAEPQKKRLRIIHGILAIIFFSGLALEASYESTFALELGLLIQLFVVSTEIIAIWKMYRQPEASSRGRALFISSWAMVLGFALAVVFPYQRIHFLHVVYILGFLGGTLAIGAHVLVNHEAMNQSLLKKNWPLGYMTMAIVVATSLRVLAPFWEAYYISLLGIASTLLIFTLSLWGGYFVSPLWKKN